MKQDLVQQVCGQGQPVPFTRSKWVHDSVVCVCRSQRSNDVLNQERSPGKKHVRVTVPWWGSPLAEIGRGHFWAQQTLVWDPWGLNCGGVLAPRNTLGKDAVGGPLLPSRTASGPLRKPPSHRRTQMSLKSPTPSQITTDPGASQLNENDPSLLG